MNQLKNVKFSKNKRGFSADAAPLSSALRPHLLGLIFVLGLIVVGIVGINSRDSYALSLSMTIPKNLNLSINPSANNGFGESSSGEISISTDSISGYTLNVKSKNASNDLVNSVGNAEKLTSITESLTLDEYKNGKGDNKYFNTWAFKPSSINNETNTNYVPGPDSAEGITLAKTDADNSIPATYAVAIAAKVDNTIPAGNYSNTFVLTATANEAHYTINYDAASLSGATNADAFTTQAGVITGSTQQISSVVPIKDGYEFTGWCSQPLEADGSCKGGIFQPNSYYPMCKCDTDITLYTMFGLLGSGSNCVHDGYDGPAKYYGNFCWMWQDYKTGRTWDEARTTDCPSGWHLPSQYETLLNDIGDGGQLYRAGWNGNYWSSSTSGSNYVYELSANASTSSMSMVNIKLGSPTNSVRCVTQLP